MKRSSRHIFSIFVLFILPLIALGQSDGLDQKIEVVKPYQPKLTDADKLQVSPKEEDVEFEKPELSYDNNKPFYLPVPVSKEELPGLRIKGQRLEPLYRTFIKAGAGNYSDLFGEAYYNSLRSKDKFFSAYVKHHSGKGPQDHSSFGEQKLKLSGSKLFDNTILSGKTGFHNRTIHYYGYDVDPEDIEADSIKQRYTNAFLSASFGNKNSDEQSLKYDVNTDLSYLFTKLDATEMNLSASGKVREKFQDNDVLIDGSYNFISYQFENIDNKRNIVKINASYIWKLDFGKAILGFRTATETDSLKKSKFHFYPVVKLEVPFANDNLKATAGLTGNLGVNTFSSFSNTNPFISVEQHDIRNTNEKLRFFGGISGNVFDRVSFSGQVSYLAVKDLPFFINHPLIPEEFVLVYDSTTANILQFQGEAAFSISDDLQISGKILYRNFELNAQDEPWHEPNLEYRLSGHYNVYKKIILSADIFGYGERKAPILENSELKVIKLDPVNDINFGVTYKFSRAVAVYVDFKNVLGKQYEYWNRYPVRGFNIAGGLKLNLF